MLREGYLKVRTNDVRENVKNNKNEGTKHGWSRCNITVEPINFAICFCMTFSAGVCIDLLELRACNYHYNLTLAECSYELLENDEVKSVLQSTTADVAMVNCFIQGIFPAILVLFVGPWSDKKGRKPFLLCALKGFAAYYFLWGVLSLFPRLPLFAFVFPAVILSLSGGWVIITVCTWSYICDIHQGSNRTLRFGLNTCLMWLGTLLANGLAPHVYEWSGLIGYQVILYTCSILSLVAILYAAFVLEETVDKMGQEDTMLFDFNHIKSTFQAVFVKPQKGLVHSSSIITILAIDIFLLQGDINMSYLIGKSQYNWELLEYNIFEATVTLALAFSGVAGYWIFTSFLKLHNYIVICISWILMFTARLAISSATSQSMYWISFSLLKLFSFSGSYIDTELSNVVSEKDLGKAYALWSLLDALSLLISVPMFTRLYTYLLPDKTLYLFLLSSALSAAAFLISLILVSKRWYTMYRSRWQNHNIKLQQPELYL